MVVADTDFYKALTEPLSVVQDLFLKEGNPNAFPSQVASHFENLFESKDARAKIPTLNQAMLQALRSSESSSSKPITRLVRWRCMIQDTNLGSELLPRRYRSSSDGSWKNGLYSAASSADNDQGDIDVSPNELTSLNTLYAVSQPGQTSWSQLADEQLDMECELSDQVQSLKIGSSSSKSVSGIPSKLPTGSEVGVLLKVYDEDIAESVRVTQVVDVIGILDQSTLPAADWSQTNDAANALHPALHVISMQKIDQIEPTMRGGEEQVRKELISYLAEHLMGDRLAAEWVLLAMIARIHTRSSSHIVGPLTLNISSFPPSSKAALLELLENVLPFVMEQSLDLAHLNDKDTHFSPRGTADEASGLQAGRLQLVDGTMLVIDENAMQEGQLKEKGIDNIRILSTMLTTKKLAYTFPFSSLEMDVDVGCIILSQGKSFMPFDVQVPLRTAVSTAEESRSSKQVNLPRFRQYISTVQAWTSRVKNFTIDADISEKIQTDFVQSRSAKREAKTVDMMETQEDLSRVLHVARLTCLSRGASKLTWDDWQQAKGLDADRLLRLR